MSRTAIAGVLTALVMVALLGSWFASGWQGVRADQRTIRAAPAQQSTARARALAWTLDARLDELRLREDARPYYHYQSLFHDPRASEGAAVAPSPLSGGPDDPLVIAHFQIDAVGAVTLPTLNEQVPELNLAGLDDNLKMRDAIAAVSGSLQVTGAGLVAAATAVASNQPPEQAKGSRRAGRQQQQQQAGPRVEVLDQQAYVQNNNAVEVYQNARMQQQQQQQDAPAPQRRAPPAQQRELEPPMAPLAEPVAITVAPLTWRTVEVAGAPALAALRRVETPDGVLTQGLLVSLTELRAYITDLTAEDGAEHVDLVRSVAGSTAAAPLMVDGGHWSVVVEDPAAIRDADRRAGALGTAFLGRFVPTAVLATTCAALVVLLVARADRAAQQRAQFAAAAAHELRTPLAGLQLYGDMLADGLGNPERSRDYARRMSEEAARLGRVVSNVLDFSRLERGNLSVSAQRGDAAEVVRAAIERARPALERAGATLHVDVPDAALPARLDSDALARILGNLLDNAEKYGRAAADRTVTVSATGDAERVTITVRDAGPGVTPGTQQMLFVPFERGVTSDGPPGLGLGLSLSRSLARAMGGDLQHRHAPGGGATFEVTLAAT